jgi:hypothetical protein
MKFLNAILFRRPDKKHYYSQSVFLDCPEINKISDKTIQARNDVKDLGEVADELKAATAQFKIDSEGFSLN